MVCDAIARRQRMMGVDTCFLTGTDEHGQKIERSAAAAGCSPKEFVDKIAGEFRGLWDRMKITYDDFIRTTEPRHMRGVQALFTRLQERGYIYKGSYSGQYCVFDELYVDAVGPGAPCPECGRPTETVHEENYFFKLSAMEERLLKLYAEHPDFIRPETRRNEVIAFVRSGLRDLVGQPHHVQVGHSGAGRSQARHLRLAGRAGELHDRRRLRLGRSQGPEEAASTTGPPTCT